MHDFMIQSTQLHQPQTLAEIQELCASSQRLLPIGGRTKTSLSTADAADVRLLDMRGYSGIVSYDASEFLVTVRGGTTVNELAAALAAEGQYLPFDPVFARRGATIGGSIASGISGPCRLLYGGLRDFMLEVALCDTAGREIRGGGKVVKNAAGFDLPKLVVGSYGRLGVITEATIKVFPRPEGNMTLRCETASMSAALDCALKLLAQPLPIAALEIEQPAVLMVRLSGPLDSLPGMADRVVSILPRRQQITRIAPGEEETGLWLDRAEFRWADDAQALARVAVAHHQCQALCAALAAHGDVFRHVLSCGASVLWIAVEKGEHLPLLDTLLGQLQLAGVVISGPRGLTLLGDKRWVAMADRIQVALDTERKLLAYSV